VNYSQANLRITSTPTPPSFHEIQYSVIVPVTEEILLTYIDHSHRSRRSVQERCIPYVLATTRAYIDIPPVETNSRDTNLRPHAGFPDPFAVATINGEQTKTTTVSKRTLNPYWNESFDLYENSQLFDSLLHNYLPSDIAGPTKTASWQSKSLTRKSSRRRIRAS
jgi:hypothetical protein